MRALATLLIVLPLSAMAQAGSSSAGWSLGAGVSTAVIYSSCSTSTGLICPSARGPSASASLERRLSDSSWLVVGFAGAIGDSRQDPIPDSSGGARWKERRLTVDIGLRRIVTGRGAPVEVSILALGEGGYDEASATLDGNAAGEQRFSSWLAGADVGLAIDRELVTGLTLRVATPLAGAWWQKTRQRLSGSTVDGRSVDASVYLAPRLELRLAF